MELNRENLMKRFMRKAIKGDSYDDCWRWNRQFGSRPGMQEHRAKFYIKQNLQINAHRFSAFLFLGFDLRSNMQVLHKCNNEICVNPAHLYIGSVSDNMQNRIEAGNNPMLNKTHCPQGHEYSDDNTYYDGKGHRHCKTCMEVRSLGRSKNPES